MSYRRRGVEEKQQERDSITVFAWRQPYETRCGS